MMLVCIPLFAFVLKILYITTKRYYIEHLVYALHIHTFLYMGIIVTSLLAMVAKSLGAGYKRTDYRPALLRHFCSDLSFYSPRLSQGWFFSAFKFLLGGVVYLVILILGVAGTALVTLLLPN
jgi:hypothetical protein